MSAERIYACPKCGTLCIKNVKKLPSGTVLHLECGTEVKDVTEEVDQHNTAPAGPFD